MKKLLYIIAFYCFILPYCYATESNPTLGYLEPSNAILTHEETTLPTYDVLGEDYIPVASLRNFDCLINYDSPTNTILVEPNTSDEPDTTLSNAVVEDLTQQPFMLYDGIILIDGFQTHGVIANGRTLIPLGALRQLYDISIDGPTYLLTNKSSSPYTVNQFRVENQSTTPSALTFTDVYFDEEYIYDIQTTSADPSTTIERSLTPPTESSIYVSSIIDTINETPTNTLNMNGQIKPELFELYTYAVNRNIDATIGDMIPLEEILLAEATVNNLDLSSKTPYLVWTDISSQSTYIFEGSKGDWVLIKHFLCSTGKAHSPTPTGSFQLTYKVPYFGVEKGYRCKNAFGFIGTTYLYHSVMFDVSGSYLLEGKGELGTPASAGCIRLSVPHSEWFYENMISGTTVYID